jgi:hypothetical protein
MHDLRLVIHNSFVVWPRSITFGAKSYYLLPIGSFCCVVHASGGNWFFKPVASFIC